MTFRTLSCCIQDIAQRLIATADEFEHLDAEIARKLLELVPPLEALSDCAVAKVYQDPLPPGQARVLAFLRDFIHEYRMAPTRAEIARGLGFASPNAAQDHLEALARKGLITLVEGQSRGIRINSRRSTLTRKRA